MPPLPPPTAVVMVSVPQIAAASWEFSSTTKGLVTKDGALDLTIPGFKDVSPVYIKFVLTPSPGMTAEYLPPPVSPPSIVIWNEKNTLPECFSADKIDPPNRSQGAKVTFIDSLDIQLEYGNHTKYGRKYSKCNYYSMSIKVGDATTPPALVSQDPVITNGDGSACKDHSGNFIRCLTRRSRKQAARSSQALAGSHEPRVGSRAK